MSVDMTKDEIHKSLSNTAVMLTSLFWGRSREEITKRPNETDWCPLEILVHLRMVAETYTERIHRILTAEEGDDLIDLHDYDEFKQMKKVDLDEETPKANIRFFMKARSEMLNMISFDDDIWENKKAVHETLGVVTIRQLLIPLVLREKQFIEKLQQLIPE